MTIRVDELLDELSSLSVLEAIELVKKLETRWGVSSLQRISRVFTIMPGEPVEPPQTEFDVVIIDCGPRKIEVIKVIRSLMLIGLKEAKDAAETLGYVLFKEVDIEVAMDAKHKLEEAGATVKLV